MERAYQSSSRSDGKEDKLFLKGVFGKDEEQTASTSVRNNEDTLEASNQRNNEDLPATPHHRNNEEQQARNMTRNTMIEKVQHHKISRVDIELPEFNHLSVLVAIDIGVENSESKLFPRTLLGASEMDELLILKHFFESRYCVLCVHL
jgi:hypothetical protein